MERRRTIRLMADKGLVSVGRRSSDLLGAGWPLRDISEGGLRFAVPADGPGLDLLRILDPGEGVVVTIEFGPGLQSGEGYAGRKRPGDEAEREAGERGRTPGPVDRTLRLSANVRRVSKPVRGEREVSLEFTGLSRRDREGLRGAVLDLAMRRIEKTGKRRRRSTGSQRRRPEPAEGRRRGGPRRPAGGGGVGDILVARRAIPREDLERFLREDYDRERPFGRQLVETGLVDETAAARALAEQAGLRYVDLGAEGIDLLMIRQFGEEFLARHLFVPLSVAGSSVTVAAAEPLGEEVLDAIRRHYNRPVRTVIASERQIVSAIQKAFHVSRNRRSRARFRAGLSVRFKLFDEKWRALHEEAQPGLTKNLSDGGMLFVGPEPEGVGLADLDAKKLHVGVHLFLPNDDEPVRAPCELVRTVPLREPRSAERALYLYGVSVLGVSEEDRKRLNLFRLRAYISWSARAAGE